MRSPHERILTPALASICPASGFDSAMRNPHCDTAFMQARKTSSLPAGKVMLRWWLAGMSPPFTGTLVSQPGVPGRYSPDHASCGAVMSLAARDSLCSLTGLPGATGSAVCPDGRAARMRAAMKGLANPRVAPSAAVPDREPSRHPAPSPPGHPRRAGASPAGSGRRLSAQALAGGLVRLGLRSLNQIVKPWSPAPSKMGRASVHDPWASAAAGPLDTCRGATAGYPCQREGSPIGKHDPGPPSDH